VFFAAGEDVIEATVFGCRAGLAARSVAVETATAASAALTPVGRWAPKARCSSDCCLSNSHFHYLHFRYPHFRYPHFHYLHFHYLHFHYPHFRYPHFHYRISTTRISTTRVGASSVPSRGRTASARWRCARLCCPRSTSARRGLQIFLLLGIEVGQGFRLLRLQALLRCWVCRFLNQLFELLHHIGFHRIEVLHDIAGTSKAVVTTRAEVD